MKVMMVRNGSAGNGDTGEDPRKSPGIQGSEHSEWGTTLTAGKYCYILSQKGIGVWIRSRVWNGLESGIGPDVEESANSHNTTTQQGKRLSGELGQKWMEGGPEGKSKYEKDVWRFSITPELSRR
ncbi:hypothetical protein B0H10DRAFT_1941163 [Mycena sp. CBHHK59/15]|nr:hypothetical protein B0H10DRAFT_1941163 [Mycena sp. CBHHK59/15]